MKKHYLTAEETKDVLVAAVKEIAQKVASLEATVKVLYHENLTLKEIVMKELNYSTVEFMALTKELGKKNEVYINTVIEESDKIAAKLMAQVREEVASRYCTENDFLGETLKDAKKRVH